MKNSINCIKWGNPSSKTDKETFKLDKKYYNLVMEALSCLCNEIVNDETANKAFKLMNVLRSKNIQKTEKQFATPSKARKELRNKLLKEIVRYGHRYERHVTNEGTVESGPYALDFVGVRYGRVYLELSPNGMIDLFVNMPRNPCPMFFDIHHTDLLYGYLRSYILTGNLPSTVFSSIVYGE